MVDGNARFTQADGVSLKEHLEKMLVAQADFFSAKIDAIERAIVVAREAQDIRLEGMNEFRREIEKLTVTLVPKNEIRPQVERVSKDIEDVRKALSLVQLRSDTEARRSHVDSQIAELQAFKNQVAGKASQSSVYIAYGISLIGIALGVLGLLAR